MHIPADLGLPDKWGKWSGLRKTIAESKQTLAFGSGGNRVQESVASWGKHVLPTQGTADSSRWHNAPRLPGLQTFPREASKSLGVVGKHPPLSPKIQCRCWQLLQLTRNKGKKLWAAQTTRIKQQAGSSMRSVGNIEKIQLFLCIKSTYSRITKFPLLCVSKERHNHFLDQPPEIE